MLQIRLLGQFDVRLDGKRVIISSRAGQSLLAYLALTAGTLHRREKLAGVFWPDTNDETARKNLRQELWRIRKAISTLEPSRNDFLVADEYTLKFNNSAEYWLDVAQMERPDHDLQSLIANLPLYQGELLPGFYDDWVGIERERIQGIFDLRIEELLEQLSASERWVAVQEWGERWLTLSGARESAYRYLMLASAARGEVAKVAALYQRCQDDLLQQLGVAPSAETRALYEGLLKSTKSTTRAPAQLSGTITFLFTDIEGSTRLLEKLGDQYAVALSEHHEILRAAVKKWNGREIDTQGDAFFVTFTRALDAVQCAAEAQRALTEHAWQNSEALRVRMGLHTGEPLIASTGYLGMDVHRAARIGDAGHGGQILLSLTTRELVYQELPAGLTLRELGEHCLKDMKYPMALYQLVVEGLPDNFAPIRTRFTGTESPTPGEPPFKGLQFFDEEDANLFFGREALTSKLIRHLQNANFLSVIIGASGSGKSSLVRAGLVPALKKGIALTQSSPLRKASSDWTIHIMTPTVHPLEALAIELTRASESVTAASTLLDDLSKDPRSLHFFLSRGSPLQHTLLVIDQFEELFTLCHDDFEREAFIDNLLSALKPAPLPLGEARSGESRLTLIITLRADFYAHLAQYSELRDAIAQQQEYIGPMTSEELRRAIEEPAHLGHWEFEPGLVDLILRDVGDEPGALPLLSHALLETWKRRAGHTLTLKGYAEAGGVRGAIAYTAESLFQSLSQNERGIMRDILLRLTEFGEGTEDTRRRASFEELLSQANDPNQLSTVLNRLAEARLVTLGEGTAEVAHEALIREWPKLREWLSQDREGILLHRHLTEAAQEWALLERDTDALYRGVRLAQANEWSVLNPGALNAQEKMFLEASNARAMQEIQEREEQRQRELDLQRQRANEQAQAAKQLRRRAMYLTGALIVAGVLAATAVVFGQRANQEANLSASRELAAASITNLDVDPERSVLLALHAVSITHTLEAEDALHRAVQASRVQLTLSSHADWVNRVVFSPDGKRLATTSDDGTTKVWDAFSGQELLNLTGHGDWVMGVAYSPDGTRLATVGHNSTAKVWDVDTGSELLTLNVNMDWAWGIAFSPDGTRLAIGGPARAAEVWNATTGEKLLTLTGHTNGIWDLAFSRDGTRLATASWDETARVWDANTGEAILTLTGHSGTVRSVAFSPNGRYLATASDDDTAKVWDITTGTELLNISVHRSPVLGVVFNQDGTRLFTASIDRTVKMWQLAYSSDGNAITGQELLTLYGHAETIAGLALSPDGMRLATASADRTARVWDISPERGKELLTLSGLDAESNSIAFNPNGKYLATASNDGTAKVWDATTGREVLTLRGHTSPVGLVTYSPDGKRIATASLDGTGRLWDATSGRQLLTLSDHTDLVNGIAFSPDGKRIATASEDKTAIVWDANTGEQLVEITPQPDEILVVTFSPDGSQLATAGREGIPKIWDATTGQILLELKSQSYNIDQAFRVWSVAFSPDGTRLAAGSQDGLVKVWDTRTGEVLRTLAGHNGEVVIVSFSPDGNRLASSSRDGSAKIWNATTGQNLLTLEAGDGGGLTGVAFDPSGARLATSGDRGIRVFALRIEDLIALARSRLTRSLTTEECQKYLHVQECPSIP